MSGIINNPGTKSGVVGSFDDLEEDASQTTLGTVTSGTISTGVVVDDPTMTQGSDATGDVYYRAADGKLTRLATGADGTVLTSTGAGAVPAFEAGAFTAAGEGTTQAQTWYVTGTYAADASDDVVESWAENNGGGYNRLGTSMTYSSGVFTYPVTGWWYVHALMNFEQRNVAVVDNYSTRLEKSTDSGSNWSIMIMQHQVFSASHVLSHGQEVTVACFHKVTNASNDRFRMFLGGIDITNNSFNVVGSSMNTAEGGSHINFIRLASV